MTLTITIEQQMSNETKPILSDEQIEWHSVHDKKSGELVSIQTMSPWTCREIYEAELQRINGLKSELIDILNQIVTLTDRKHDLWDKAKSIIRQNRRQ